MERLGDVVVRAEVQALCFVGGRALRREEDDRHGPAFPKLAHDLDPVEVGHHDVEEDDVWPDFLGLDQRVLAPVCGHDPEALFAQGD